MKKIFISALAVLGLIGCEGEAMVDYPSRGEVVWINNSGHVVRITALGEGNLVFTLSTGERYQYDHGNYMSGPPEWHEFEKIDVYFDGGIHVPYVQQQSGAEYPSLEPPAGYPVDASLCDRSRYRYEYRFEKPFHIGTQTYTFTDADYEAAKAWSEKQTE